MSMPESLAASPADMSSMSCEVLARNLSSSYSSNHTERPFAKRTSAILRRSVSAVGYNSRMWQTYGAWTSGELRFIWELRAEVTKQRTSHFYSWLM